MPRLEEEAEPRGERGASAGRTVPISWIFALGTIGIILPLIILGSISLNRWLEKLSADEIGSVRSHAFALARAVDRELKGHIETAEVLAASSYLRNRDIQGMEQLSRDAARKTGGNFLLHDKSLRRLVDTRIENGGSLPQDNPPASVRSAFSSVGPVVEDVVVEQPRRKPQVYIQLPIRIEDSTEYVLSYAPNEDSISELLSETLRPPGWLAAVIDGKGIIISRSHRNPDFAGTPASTAFLESMTGKGGVVASRDREGREAVTAYEGSSLSSWRAVVWAPKDVLAAPKRRAFMLVIAACALALAVSLLCAWIVGRLIGSATAKLALASKSIGAGRDVEVPPTFVREASTIGGALQYASRLIADRERELREGEERLRLALEGANAGAWELGSFKDKLKFTAEFAALCGMGDEPGAMAPAAWLDQCVANEDKRPLGKAVARALSGRASRVQREFRVNLPDGRLRWLLAMGQIQIDAEGKRCLHGIVIDITARKAAEAVTARLASIVDSSSDAIVSKSPDGIVTSWNAGAEALFGYQMHEIVGHSIRVLVPPERQSEEDQILDRIAAGDRVEPFDTVRLHKSGRPVDVSVSISPIFDASGKVIGASKIARDIRERKAAAEKLLVLMREVNHRSKNLLSITQSIARHTAASGAKDFVERFHNRLQALSANQDILVRNEWSGVNLEELAKTQLAMFKDLIGERITIEGPDILLSSSAAQAIGMAIHELATNAVKYGALANTAGRIDLRWRIDGPQLQMSWREIDGPPVAPPGKKGFGTNVLKQLVEHGVSGKVALSYDEPGLSWQLTCPLNVVIAQESAEATLSAKIAGTADASPPALVH